jgi:predicted phage terminase large subunit-like protein
MKAQEAQDLPLDLLQTKVEKLWLEHIKLCQDNFLYFVKEVWPDIVMKQGKDKDSWGHHQIMAHEFTKIATLKKGRLIINMPPRHTKSEFSSFLYPAWMIGKFPKMKIMQVTHNAELSARFGAKIRNLMDTPKYKEIFGDVFLRPDAKAKSKWETNHGGEYFAAGVGGSITGRGADLLIIDDPHTEQDAFNKASFPRTYDWYLSGPRQRLQPGGSIVLVMTRWATNDLTGLLKRAESEPKADKWSQISFPALLENGEPLWPEYWSQEDLERTKASISVRNWTAQYQQDPTSEEGAILKREWWQPWEGDLPELEYVIQSYDTAFSKKETADYSAITTWGVFKPYENYPRCLILLDAEKGKYDFPELKTKAFELYKYWEPDMCVVEAKASGQPLLQEFRRAGIPAIDYSPNKGRDKHTRVNSCAPAFESGQIFYPKGEKFAEEVIEECAAFPNGEYDDYVDSTTQAVLRYRQGGFLQLTSDYEEAERPPKEYKYYG